MTVDEGYYCLKHASGWDDYLLVLATIETHPLYCEKRQSVIPRRLGPQERQIRVGLECHRQAGHTIRCRNFSTAFLLVASPGKIWRLAKSS
jgi:hypothetical protein